MLVFTALRHLNLLKADDVVYRMVIKSLVKRRRRVQDPVPPIDVDAGLRDEEEKEEKHIDRFEFLPSFLHFTVYPVLHCAAIHYPVLHYTTLHYTTLHYTTLHYTTQYCTLVSYTY